MDRKEIAAQVQNAVETVVIKGTNLLPFVKPNQQEVVDRVNELSHNVLNLQRPVEFFDERLLVSTLDEAAREYVRTAQVVATTSGGATGIMGIPGLAIDLPILVATTVGMVRRHALVYGFTDIEEARGDRVPLLLAFGAALGADKAIDQIALRVGSTITGGSAQRMLTRVVSEEMASTLVTRWFTRAVPVISSITSAGLNYLFLREAGRRSISYYRFRHEVVRRQIAAAKDGQAARGDSAIAPTTVEEER